MDDGNNSSNNNNDNNDKPTSQASDIIGTWINIDGSTDIAIAFAHANEYIKQQNYELAKEIVLDNTSSGYKITRSAIHRFCVAVNKTQKSGQTTLKTLYFPDGTRYYLQMEDEGGCSYWFRDGEENYFETADYSYFTFSYYNGVVNYLERRGSEAFMNINVFYSDFSDYSWIR